MLRHALLYVLAALVLLSPPGTAAQTAFQDPASIRAAALAALGEDAAAAQATVDPALRMPACTTALQGLPVSATSVEVGCEGSWRLFVPVRVQRVVPVVVLAVPVAAGQTLGPEHLRVEQRDASRLAGTALRDPAQAVGQVLRRSARAGMPLAASDRTTATLIRRGDQVTLLARAGGVEVRMAGRAMGQAGAGQRLSAENLSSRRVVQGVLGADGVLVVGP
jgi:flagella basal body P-ring formation protein FlgA